jgi:type I restriction enzyme S subunit
MSFPRYERYKDSGVEWLGEVPEDWAVIPLGALADLIQTGPFGSQLHSEEYVEDATPVINPSNIQDGKLIPDWSCTVGWEITERLSQHKLMRGDIIFGRRGEMGRCAVVSANEAGWICGTGSLNIRLSSRAVPSFVGTYLRTMYVRELLKLESVGSTMDNLNAQILSRVPIPNPPVVEQKAIAAFLDRETGTIDALIAEQRRLINLLKEKRQAVVSHAVTKGLNPDAPMKDSEVDGVGEVPAHWEVKRLKHLVHSMVDTEHKTVPFDADGEYLVVRTSNVKDGQLILEGAKYTDQDGFAEWTRRGTPSPGDILFTREAPAGEACIVPEGVPLCLGQRMVLFRVDQRIFDSKFGIYSIYGGLASEFIKLLSQGSTVVHFNMADIGNIPLLIPPLAEQQAISTFLDRETARIDALVAEAETAITLLQERRTALISAAVTGKIDVRGLVAAREAVPAGVGAGADPSPGRFRLGALSEAQMHRGNR